MVKAQRVAQERWQSPAVDQLGGECRVITIQRTFLGGDEFRFVRTRAQQRDVAVAERADQGGLPDVVDEACDARFLRRGVARRVRQPAAYFGAEQRMVDFAGCLKLLD